MFTLDGFVRTRLLLRVAIFYGKKIAPENPESNNATESGKERVIFIRRFDFEKITRRTRKFAIEFIDSLFYILFL